MVFTKGSQSIVAQVQDFEEFQIPENVDLQTMDAEVREVQDLR